MNSIVLELQRDALDRKVTISDLLRKSLVVAKKLKISQFETWIINELSGYKNKNDIPDYRKVKGTVEAWNPYHGWQPILFPDNETETALSMRPCVQSIAEIESIILNRNERSTLQMPYPPDIETKIRKAIDGDTNVTLILSMSSMVKIVDAVRTIVLNWSLKLEEDNILGEGMSFTSNELATAGKTPYNINNFYGPVQSPLIQQGGDKSAQIIMQEKFNINDLKNVIKVLREQRESIEIGKEDGEELDSEIHTLEAQASSSKPKYTIIKESLKSIKRILEGAGGGVAAQILIKVLSLGVS